MELSEKEIFTRKHPYYRFFYMTEEEIKIEVKDWSRLDLINWLNWNDRNGIFSDKEVISIRGYVISREEALEMFLDNTLNQ